MSVATTAPWTITPAVSILDPVDFTIGLDRGERGTVCGVTFRRDDGRQWERPPYEEVCHPYKTPRGNPEGD